MKKLTMAKSVYDLEKEIEFRQWCLEQAIKWPREFAHGGGMMQGSYTPAHDVDLITRAKTIYDWVKGISK